MSQSSTVSPEIPKAEGNGLRPLILDPKNSKIDGNGLRDFILDSKASVKKYIENNMGPTNPSHHPGQWSQSDGFSQSPPLPHRPGSGEKLHSFTGYNPDGPVIRQPTPVNPAQFPVAPYGAADHVHSSPAPIASHVKESPRPDFGSFGPPPPVPTPYPQHDPAGYGGVSAPSRDPRLVGPAPPPAEPHAIATLSAPRLYHRMITEFETIKAVFYAARIQPVHNDLTPIASKLKALCREIWSIRYMRSSEFPYNEATTEERITEWKAEFEYWTDVVEDLLDRRYVAKAELELSQDDWPSVAGLTLEHTIAAVASPQAASVAPKKKMAAKITTTVTAPDDSDSATAPVVKKKVAKPAAVDGEAAPVKKKVVKKVAAAE